jgi:PHP family Zn ribbon phosphoesterase
MIILGIAEVLYAVMMKGDNRLTICATCRDVFETLKVPDRKCPKCGADLEPLKGFYDRHPELRGDTEPRGRKQDP